MERWQQQRFQAKEGRLVEEIHKGGSSQKVWTDPTIKKEAKLLRCTLLNGSEWSTQRKYMRRYKGKCDVFFGIEHRLKEEEMGGAVQQRGQRRMEVCSGCSKNHRYNSREEFLWRLTATWEQ